ncbi:MAG: SRPBCC domain-containing protein [Pseudolysinimonas sp.]
MAEYATAVEIRATPDEVFEFLVTPAGITAWMGEHAVLEPHPGGTFEVDISGAPIRGRFLEVDRPHRVVVSWGMAGSEEFPAGSSRVTFSLTPIETGTRVELLHAELPDERVAGHVDGWGHFLSRLTSIAQGVEPAADEWMPLPWRGIA